LDQDAGPSAPVPDDVPARSFLRLMLRVLIMHRLLGAHLMRTKRRKKKKSR
jgi:hypothetical protein